MSQDLPEGWVDARIGDVYDSWGGMTPSKGIPTYWNGGTPWLSSKDVKNWRVSHGTHFITRKALAETKLRVCPVGTVLLVVRSGVLVHSLPVALTTAEVTINQDLKAFDSGDADLNEWLAFSLRAHAREILAANRKDGTTVQSVRVDDLLERRMAVPPLAEQRRIIEAVDALLAQVHAARQRLTRVPLILKRFHQAVLAAACSGKLTEDRDAIATDMPAPEAVDRWSDPVRVRRGVPEEVAVPDIIADVELPVRWAKRSVAALLRSGALLDVKDGNHGANHPKTVDFTSKGLPFITAAQVNGYEIDYDSAPKVSGEALRRLRVGFARPGDVVLTHKGSVGRVAVCNQECVLTPQTTYYRCNPQVIDAQYLALFFASMYFFNQMANVMSQTTRDFVPISEQYSLFVFLPPPQEQREIVRRAQRLLSLADTADRRVAAASTRADALTQSVLAKAFRGELVATEAEIARAKGHEFESAAALLARVEIDRSGGVRSMAGHRRTPRRARAGA